MVPLDRRLMLRAGGSFATARLLGANDRIRIAAIGCGAAGKLDVAAFLQSPDVDCPVICDVDDARLAGAASWVERARGRRPDAVKDFRRAIERKDVDALLVATPDHWHALPVIYACQAGKDVYVETPLATTVAEGRAMVHAAERHGRVVQVGAHWRGAPHFQEAGEFVRSGRLGRIRQIRAWAHVEGVGDIGSKLDSEVPTGVDYDMWLGPAPRRPFHPNRFHGNFRWFWDYAGGLLTDWGGQILTLMSSVGGGGIVRRVVSTGTKNIRRDDSETPETQIALYDFGGTMLTWEHQLAGGIGINGYPQGLCYYGTEAALIAGPRGWEVIPEPERKSERALVRGAVGGADGRTAHVREFLECMRTRRPPAVNPRLAHRAATLAHLGNIAVRTGSQVIWDHMRERIVDNPEADRLLSREYRAPWALPRGG